MQRPRADDPDEEKWAAYWDCKHENPEPPKPEKEGLAAAIDKVRNPDIKASIRFLNEVSAKLLGRGRKEE